MIRNCQSCGEPFEVQPDRENYCDHCEEAFVKAHEDFDEAGFDPGDESDLPESEFEDDLS